MPRKVWIFSLALTLGIALDQISKALVRASATLDEPGGMPIIPHFLNFVHAENPGAAFGMLGGLSPNVRVALFLSFTAVAAVVISRMWWKLPRRDWFLSLTLGLILSGALGNAIDRIAKRTVTDFIQVYTDSPGLADWLNTNIPGIGGSRPGFAEYPSFNIADSALFVGVGMYLVYYLFVREEDDEDEDDEVLDDTTGPTDETPRALPDRSTEPPRAEGADAGGAA